MALPGSGTISLSAVNVELGRSSTAAINMNETTVRQLAGVGSGGYGMNAFYGKSNNPTFNYAPGTYDLGDTSIVLTASFAVTWTWTKTGHASSVGSPASGSTSTNLSLQAPTPAATSQVRQSTFNVSAAGKSWVFRFVVQGNNGGGLN